MAVRAVTAIRAAMTVFMASFLLQYVVTQPVDKGDAPHLVPIM
jgi:hypothetical protein